MELTALQIADLNKNRRQIELFFKWLKQHLTIKKLWGTTENAVRIQIYSAICAYCLVAIVQHDMRLDRNTYEVLQTRPFLVDTNVFIFKIKRRTWALSSWLSALILPSFY